MDDLSVTGFGADDLVSSATSLLDDTTTTAAAFGNGGNPFAQSAASSWQQALSEAGLAGDATLRTSDANVSGRDPNVTLAQASGPVLPGGVTQQPIQGVDPLDPTGINVTPTVQEQVAIAATLNAIQAGTTQGLTPHTYKNFPDRSTGAVLPPSAAGYTTYDVDMGGAGRGANRLIIDNGSGAMFYTNNHYQSFFPLIMSNTP